MLRFNSENYVVYQQIRNRPQNRRAGLLPVDAGYPFRHYCHHWCNHQSHETRQRPRHSCPQSFYLANYLLLDGFCRYRYLCPAMARSNGTDDCSRLLFRVVVQWSDWIMAIIEITAAECVRPKTQTGTTPSPPA